MQLVEAERTMRQEVAFAKGRKISLLLSLFFMQEGKKDKYYNLFAF